jgi:hypothetical protein
MDEGRGVRGASYGLGPHERDRRGTQASGGFGVAGQRRDELIAGVRPDEAVRCDPVTQAEERGLVEERLDQVAGHRGDQEVGAVGADIDRGRDDGRGQGHDLRRGLGLRGRHGLRRSLELDVDRLDHEGGRGVRRVGLGGYGFGDLGVGGTRVRYGFDDGVRRRPEVGLRPGDGRCGGDRLADGGR